MDMRCPVLNPLSFLSALTLSVAFLSPAQSEDKVPPPPPENAASTPSNGSSPGRGRTPFNVEEYLKRMDANGDGKVSKEEFMAFHQKELEERFKRLDANGDGFVDKSELEQAMKSLRGGEGMGARLRERMQERRESSGGVRKKPDASTTNSDTK